MSFEVLPPEVFENILDCLPFKSLLSSSRVCRQWNAVAGVLIGRKAVLDLRWIKPTVAEILRNSNRNYSVVMISLGEWEQLQAVLDSDCAKFRPRELRIECTRADLLNHFCTKYQSLLENLVTLALLMDRDDGDFWTHETESYSLSFPTVEDLMILDYLSKTVRKSLSLNVPKLKHFQMMDEGSAKTSALKIVNCQQLVKMECKLCWKKLPELFECSFPYLSRLELTFEKETDTVQFLNNLPNLKWLKLEIKFPKDRMETLSAAASDAIANCRQLECLRYAIMNESNEVTSLCRFNLSRFAKAAEHLNRLELSRMHLTIDEGPVCLPSVELLNFREISFVIENATTVRLEAPRLASAFMSVNNLSDINPVGKWPLVELFVDLRNVLVRDALDANLVPFMANFDGLKRLMLHRRCSDYILDEDFSPSIQLRVEILHLRDMNLRLECFERVSKWSQLKRLHLENCIIDTEGALKTVRLNHMELGMRGVSLSRPFEGNFPLVVDGIENLERTTFHPCCGETAE